jgi:hypothetical protein
MKPKSLEAVNLNRILTFGLTLALLTCPVFAVDWKAGKVPDQNDEVAFSIAVLGLGTVSAIPDCEDDECDLRADLDLLQVILPRPGNVDLDVFSFDLTLASTIRLESHGETDTYGQLLDEAGRHLASDDDGGDAANFQIIKTLDPGRYFLEVEGAQGATGPYVLTATLNEDDPE